MGTSPCVPRILRDVKAGLLLFFNHSFIRNNILNPALPTDAEGRRGSCAAVLPGRGHFGQVLGQQQGAKPRSRPVLLLAERAVSPLSPFLGAALPFLPFPWALNSARTCPAVSAHHHVPAHGSP